MNTTQLLQEPTVMHVSQKTPQLLPVLRCDYDHAYESIYDSGYGTCFVFYDEEEFETNDGYSSPQISNGNMMPSGFSQR